MICPGHEVGVYRMLVGLYQASVLNDLNATNVISIAQTAAKGTSHPGRYSMRCSHLSDGDTSSSLGLLPPSHSQQPHFVLIPSTCGTFSIACNHPTLVSTNCSACGRSFVSCNCKSSIVPILQKLRPGKPLLRRYMRVPQMEQKELVIVLPVPMVSLVL